MKVDDKIQRAGFFSIALGILSVLLCELPLLLTIVGFGSLASVVSTMHIARVEFAGAVLALAGVLLLMFLRVKRLRNQTELGT